MRLFLVRHGETDHNRGGLALGRADVPLNDTGREQARRLGDALTGEQFAALYSSPLQRTRATAEAIAAKQDMAVVLEPRLIEMDVGELDGMPMVEVRAQHPEFIAQWLSPAGHLAKMPGGECMEDVRARSWGLVREWAAKHPEETICAVTHNFVILTALAAALGLEPAGFRRIRHGVGAISVIYVTGERAQVLRLNDACHLG